VTGFTGKQTSIPEGKPWNDQTFAGKTFALQAHQLSKESLHKAHVF
jgi:hypothetical protein